MSKTLSDLPDDILFIIFDNFDTARELRTLALQNKRLHRLVENDGWRIFVRKGFRSLSVPNPSRETQSWRQLAESLTWQSRCWDRRSLQFQALLPQPESRQPRYTRGGNFQPIVDAHLDTYIGEELVVWGAGEDIVARYRLRGGRDDDKTKVTWAHSLGKPLGLKSGYDDVKAISIIKDRRQADGGRAFLSGRDNGELSLQSAEPDRFGERLVRFRPAASDDVDKPEQLGDHDTINSLDVLRTGTKPLIAAATKSTVIIYGLPEDDAIEASPLTTFDLPDDLLSSNTTSMSRPQFCRATWMGQGETMAVALKGCDNPLRYLSLTPSGWTLHTVGKRPDLESKFGVRNGDNENVCHNSLTAVDPHTSSRGGPSLLLSGWRDGSVRLQDLRTPSPFDTVYGDNINPWTSMETIMTYGTERFIGGGSNGIAIKIFDFRWTKGYYHTSGIPCSNKRPFPVPPQPFCKEPPCDPIPACDHISGRLCRWHDLSRQIYYRPNANLHMSNSLPFRQNQQGDIWSLAKASDISPNFYMGISGGIVEANLEPSGKTEKDSFDPNFGFKDWRDTGAEQVRYKALAISPSMMETGDGLLVRENDRSIPMPPMWNKNARNIGMQATLMLPKAGKEGHYRLDGQFQLASLRW